MKKTFDNYLTEGSSEQDLMNEARKYWSVAVDDKGKPIKGAKPQEEGIVSSKEEHHDVHRIRNLINKQIIHGVLGNEESGEEKGFLHKKDITNTHFTERLLALFHEHLNIDTSHPENIYDITKKLMSSKLKLPGNHGILENIIESSIEKTSSINVGGKTVKVFDAKFYKDLFNKVVGGSGKGQNVGPGEMFFAVLYGNIKKSKGRGDLVLKDENGKDLKLEVKLGLDARFTGEKTKHKSSKEFLEFLDKSRVPISDEKILKKISLLRKTFSPTAKKVVEKPDGKTKVKPTLHSLHSMVHSASAYLSGGRTSDEALKLLISCFDNFGDKDEKSELDEKIQALKKTNGVVSKINNFIFGLQLYSYWKRERFDILGFVTKIEPQSFLYIRFKKDEQFKDLMSSINEIFKSEKYQIKLGNWNDRNSIGFNIGVEADDSE